MRVIADLPGARWGRRGARAFTLVELLVVIGIIAVLAAILLPTIAGARKQAHVVRCLSNQRQLMTAMLLYAAANDGYPAFEGWANPGSPGSKVNNWLFNPPVAGLPPASQSGVQTGLFWPYLKDFRVFRCPVDDGPWPANSVQNVTSYVMNGAISNYTDRPIVQTIPLAKFHADDIFTWEIPLFSDRNVSVNDAANYPPEGVTLRHYQSTTVGCADGHAELIRDQDFNAWCQSGPTRLWCSPARKDGGASTFKAANPIPMFY